MAPSVVSIVVVVIDQSSEGSSGSLSPVAWHVWSRVERERERERFWDGPFPPKTPSHHTHHLSPADGGLIHHA